MKSDMLEAKRGNFGRFEKRGNIELTITGKSKKLAILCELPSLEILASS